MQYGIKTYFEERLATTTATGARYHTTVYRHDWACIFSLLRGTISGKQERALVDMMAEAVLWQTCNTNRSVDAITS